MNLYSSPHFFLVSFVFFLFSSASFAGGTGFDFASFAIRNLTLLGDAYLRNGTIGLTRDINVPASSSGSVLYNFPFRFSDPTSNSSASFFSRFVFSITNANPGSYGDGIAFFLSPNNETLGSPGRFLGLVNSSSAVDNKFVAVEFDTFLDAGLGDPNANHVGLDVGNLSSIQTLDAGTVGIDLKNGTSITAWIEYRHDTSKLMLWMSYTSLKPSEPQFSVDINLSKYFEEFMYVGFSGSTEGSTELHIIEEWSFGTVGLESKGLAPPQNGATDTESKPPLGFSQPRCHNQNCWSRKLILGLEISGSIITCMIMGYLSWILVKRWRLERPVKSFKQETLKGPKNFSYREIRAATRGFNKSNVVGYGASGTVYSGILPESGVTVAVKRSKHANQGMDDFMGELLVIVCLRHRNLVQLEGWCCEKGELLLVYEFMPNGSLDDVLHHEDDGEVLKWPHRYNIAVGTASALMYLHYECEKQIIHRDVKASNIMLDANFNPRLGDFGLAKIIEHDKSPDSTLTAGTMGYLAPEYLQYGKATEKTDAFSYGVVILEVACGRRPIEKSVKNGAKNLVDWVWELYGEGRLLEAVDPRLKGEFNQEQMRRMLLLGLSCAHPNHVERPTMRRVLQILNGDALLPVLPTVKPVASFSCSLPLSIQEILSDIENSTVLSPLRVSKSTFGDNSFP
ncbi:unnamed protein product [Victoria cruziana]